MPVPMKMLRTKGMVILSIYDEKQERRFKVPSGCVNKLLRTLENEGVLVGEEKSIPADEFFKDLDKKYTRPGVALRGARGKEGLSQGALAKKLDITQGNLSKMENGKRPIGKSMAKRLSKILNIDYRVFL